MPLPLDPNETFEAVLEHDLAKPETERPTFLFRYMSLRAFRETSWLADDDKRIAALSMIELLAALLDVIRSKLAGWRNMGIEFDPSRLDELITYREAWQLYFLARTGSRLSVPEKNSSGSGSPSSSEESAKAASPASAQTSPAPKPRPSSNAPDAPAAAATPADEPGSSASKDVPQTSSKATSGS